MTPPNRRVLLAHLAPLLSRLAPDDVTELVINRPGEVGVEAAGRWRFDAAPELTAGFLTSLALACAAEARQTIGPQHPLLSFALDDVWGEGRPGELRGQIVVAPASATGAPLMAFRKPARRPFGLGAFAAPGDGLAEPGAPAARLKALHAAQDWEAFFPLVVRSRMGVLISGATGSGKTSFAQALTAMIPPDERLITLEDARELRPPHRNVAPLLYAKDGQGVSRAGPTALLEAALRLRPDRILMQELRDASAWVYVRQALSGHPGGLPTIHAESCAAALDQLALLVREAEPGRALGDADLKQLIRRGLPVGVQLARLDGRPRLMEVRLDLDDHG